LKINN